MLLYLCVRMWKRNFFSKRLSRRVDPACLPRLTPFSDTSTPYLPSVVLQTLIYKRLNIYRFL